MDNKQNTALTGNLLEEDAIRDRVRRLRQEAQSLRDTLDQASVKIAALEEAVAHPERVLVDPPEGEGADGSWGAQARALDAARIRSYNVRNRRWSRFPSARYWTSWIRLREPAFCASPPFAPPVGQGGALTQNAIA